MGSFLTKKIASGINVIADQKVAAELPDSALDFNRQTEMN
jgi:hypothetical protein